MINVKKETYKPYDIYLDNWVLPVYMGIKAVIASIGYCA